LDIELLYTRHFLYDDGWSRRCLIALKPHRGNMDLYRIISDLVEERDRVQRIIESLEAMDDGEGKAARPRPAARGRKSMDNAARKQVSERMKLYWARRRGETEENSG
jgi:hypothetical protein